MRPFRNGSTPTAINVTKVTMGGYELKTIIKKCVQGQNDPHSIYYYWDAPPQAIFHADEPGAGITIHSATNLLNWVELTHLVNSSGAVEFTATSSRYAAQRFYRATSS